MTDVITRKGKERQGRELASTLGNAEANKECAVGKIVRDENSITAEDMERLSLRVERVEREHGEFMRVWLMPHALQCIATNRRFSVGEFCDRKSWQGVDAPDHNAQPIVARLLVEKLPQCMPFVELRRCRWDDVFEGRNS